VFDDTGATDITHFTKSQTEENHLFIPAGSDIKDICTHECSYSLLNGPILSFITPSFSTSMNHSQSFTLSLSLSLSLSQPPIKAQEMMSILQSPHDRQGERRGKSETARAK